MKNIRKINRKAYLFYAVYKNGMKIESGWEYRSDAQDRIKEATQDHPDFTNQLQVYSKVHLVREGINPDENANWQNFPESHVQARYQAAMEDFWWYGYSKANETLQNTLQAEWQALTKGKRELKARYTCPP